jgi:hypothetical protein
MPPSGARATAGWEIGAPEGWVAVGMDEEKRGTLGHCKYRGSLAGFKHGSVISTARELWIRIPEYRGGRTASLPRVEFTVYNWNRVNYVYRTTTCKVGAN